MNTFKSDIFEPNVKFSIEEASGEVDGEHILAKVRGEFFVLDGVSRNNRKYPRSLWEKVIANPEIRKKLDERRMLATIGHEQKLNDVSLLEGKISHIVTDIAIEQNKGIGEALILDTPAGRILNTLLRAGSKLFVSSRADGAFKGQDEAGLPIVDPDQYKLETFDFVIDPGFLQANPKLVESLEKLKEDSENPIIIENKGDVEMDAKLVEKLASENAILRKDLESVATEVETTKNDNVTLQEENRALKFQLERAKGHKKVAESSKGDLEKYRDLGTPEDISKVFESVQKFQAQVGNFKQVRSVMEKLETSLRRYQTLGKFAEVSEALDKAIAVVKTYKELGTPHEIKEVFNRTKKMHEKIKEERSKLVIRKLAGDLNVSEERIAKLYGKMTESEIRDFFKDLKESVKLNNTYRKTATINEDKKATPSKTSTLFVNNSAERLMESFSVPSKLFSDKE